MTLPDQHDGPLRLVVLQGSVRSERVGPAITDWVLDRVERSDRFVLDVIDLAKVRLPGPEELRPGGAGTRSEIADRIEAGDGFMIITPEYNRGLPATLKHAVDCHYAEWMFKPVLPVTYGMTGGVLAAEHLRSVFAELHAVTTRRAVTIAEPWAHLDQHGRLEPTATAERTLGFALGELAWWASALRRQRRLEPFPHPQ
ncbi:NADPH-dependent FMN reductase [Microlunatus sp. GCM10028923]|uniref:NADPH-dependent FMN reductase n=1 Tax=Microlunatus sp. GCM10028923 TaxID=3273400 RepID=UPI00360FEB67